MNKTILLIEDNPEILENTAKILELSNYNVLTAENGKTGVEIARKGKPDLIICDIMMPGLDGYGVLHMLGKSPETGGIPIILLTAKAEKSNFRKGMTLGADDYLTKPFNETELLDAVEVRLKKADLLKKEYEKSEGFDEFVDNLKGLNDLSSLTNERSLKTFKKKETVFTEDNYPSALYMVNKGKVKTFKTNEAGKELITGIHTQGDFIGYVALLEDTVYNESAEVLEDAEIYIIPKQDFFTLVYNNRKVSGSFAKMLSSDLADREERMIRLAYNSVRKRAAEALVMLDERYKKDGDTRTVIPISREDLASIVGTATESVIRTLSDFKDEKLVEVQKSDIIITNIEKLKKMKN